MADKSKEVLGLCALCGPDCDKQKALRMSHHLTKSTYKYFCRSKAEGTKLLLSQEGEKVFSLGKQIVQNLLCDECERLMSKEGEDYFSTEVLKIDRKKNLPSPIYRILRQRLVPAWNCLAPRAIYNKNLVLSVGSNFFPAIKSRQLYHYAVGFFWKATFKGWPQCPPLPLDQALIEQMRKFLLGGDFVQGYIVRVVPSFWHEKNGVALPSLIQGQPYFSVLQFDFYFERAEAQYKSAMSMDAVPLLYTVDSIKSERSYRGMVANYKRAKQSASAAGTELSWLDQ
ncbi:hypothetical protein A7D16_04910 [Xanthomonas nasturtii]|uniref:hypothetical protein n=1 Tax=Xanthomonas nasturtii TaxID=1843581 RepID=UPI0007E40313|nr:hypothetical protein [Xanthomonas nasturtii]OAX86034.1 hypothetical protein A7D16_04910 [Xanthomonas nasturtii]WVL58111.1 hypothetical protein M3O54_007725 [Xanthomonas nasturtii]